MPVPMDRRRSRGVRFVTLPSGGSVNAREDRMAFGRRKKHEAGPVDDEVVDTAVDAENPRDDADEVDAADGSDEVASSSDGPRSDGSNGPYDSTAAPAEAPTDWGRIDLGALVLTVPSGVELRFDVDQETSAVNSVVVVVDDVAVQVMAYAAPRTLGIWDDVRDEIASQLRQGPGSAEQAHGPFGPELHAHVPTDDGLLEARFMGVDGPRWFLRGVISGAGAHDDAAVGRALDVFAGTIVVRDDEARPSQEPLLVTLPVQSADGQVALGATGEAAGSDVDDQDEPLKPFERGPEITEIR
jgi:hypothetical protein